MTVSYTKKVSDCKGFGSFWRLLFRWRGSLYKLVWPDTCVYCVLYFLCSMLYRFGLNEYHRRIFEHVALYCDYFRNLIPISFVLGFYVSLVVQRWWEQYLSIPWPDSFALLCTAYIGGRGVRERSIRATVLRYVNLSCALTFVHISSRVEKKYPSYKELMEAGYLTPREMKVLENQRGRSSAPLTTLPLMWACKVVEGARQWGYVRDDHGLRLLVAELMKLRDHAGMLVRWTDISIPLVYTQVATMAVYSFFFFSVLGRQFLAPAQHYTNRTIDFFVPIFTLLQFFFYMGWLKVAESLVNPFGEDDDDFELECILARHLKMSYLLGDVTPSDDPLAEDDKDDYKWGKLCVGAHAAPTEDLAFLTRRRRGEAREQGSVEGEDAAFRRTESDLETAILGPESVCGKSFMWEEMDLSAPPDTTTRGPINTTSSHYTPPIPPPTQHRKNSNISNPLQPTSNPTTPTGYTPTFPPQHHNPTSHPLQPSSTPTTPTGSNPNLCSISGGACSPTITTTNPTPPHTPTRVSAVARDIDHHTPPPTTIATPHTAHFSPQGGSLPAHAPPTPDSYTQHRPPRNSLALDGIINPMYMD